MLLRPEPVYILAMILEIVCTISLLMIVYAYVQVTGYRIPFLERIRIALRRGERRKIMQNGLEIVKTEEKPVLRASIVMGIIVLLLILTLTHKLFWAVVISDSMRPTMKRGDIILMQAIHIDPHVGDIIMFKIPTYYLPITHRIIKMKDGLIWTGGDASGPDPWVITKKNIIAQAVMIGGRPIVIPGVGKYFILNAQKMRNIGPFGEEYLFYRNLVNAFKSYALAIVIICSALYLYLEFGRSRRI